MNEIYNVEMILNIEYNDLAKELCLPVFINLVELEIDYSMETKDCSRDRTEHDSYPSLYINDIRCYPIQDQGNEGDCYIKLTKLQHEQVEKFLFETIYRLKENIEDTCWNDFEKYVEDYFDGFDI